MMRDLRQGNNTPRINLGVYHSITSENQKQLQVFIPPLHTEQVKINQLPPLIQEEPTDVCFLLYKNNHRIFDRSSQFPVYFLYTGSFDPCNKALKLTGQGLSSSHS